MKVLNHIHYEEGEVHADTDTAPWDDVEGLFDNRAEQIVRIGGEVFESHWNEDYYCFRKVVVDPRRSFAHGIQEGLDNDDLYPWTVTNALVHLVEDFGIEIHASAVGMREAFHTVFPSFAGQLMTECYGCGKFFCRKSCCLPLVMNNPLFHTDSRAAESRLLEIAEDAGCRYAVDLANEIPSAEVLAREVALVNHIHEGDEAVAEAEARLLPDVRECIC